MKIRGVLASILLTAAVALTGCASDSQAPSPEETTPSSPTAADSATAKISTSAQPSSETSETSSSATFQTPTPEEPVQQRPSAMPAPAPTPEPVVVECLFGTPGPARWSDGTTRFSQWCYDTLTADRGDYQCPGTDAFVDDPSMCTPEFLGGEPLPQQAPTPTAAPYPPQQRRDITYRSSGEAQSHMACHLGTITDQELCSTLNARYGPVY